MHFNWRHQFSTKQTQVYLSKRQLPISSFPCKAAGSDYEAETLAVYFLVVLLIFPLAIHSRETVSVY